MKYSLKKVYKNLLKEEEDFSYFIPFDEEYEDDDTSDNMIVQIVPSKKSISKKPALKNKNFIYNINNIEKLGLPGDLTANFVDVVSFGRLDSIHTSLDQKYEIYQTKVSKSSFSIINFAGRMFFDVFKSLYLNRSLLPSSNSIDFNSEATKSKLKDMYIKSIEDFLKDKSLNLTNNKSQQIVMHHHSKFLNSLPDSGLLQKKKIVYNNPKKDNDYFTIEDRSFFELL